MNISSSPHNYSDKAFIYYKKIYQFIYFCIGITVQEYRSTSLQTNNKDNNKRGQYNIRNKQQQQQYNNNRNQPQQQFNNNMNYIDREPVQQKGPRW